MIAPPKVRYDWIYAVVRRIPRGRVSTYGQIADIAGIPGQSRRVGYALSALKENSNVPWHRVINAKGEISVRSQSGTESLQRRLLENEGVRFSPQGRVDLNRFRWQPKY